jgi:hypothetical protein
MIGVRQRPAEERERGLVGPLDEHRVRPEAAQLAGDPPRQERVEEHALERPAECRCEDEARVGAGADAGAEDAHVEELRERVEAAGERLVERKAVAAAGDHQQARSRGHAGSAAAAVRSASS